jgi:hypothetical protein
MIMMEDRRLVMSLEYSQELTDRFLNKYKELESLANTDYRKWSFITKKYRKEYEMFRHIRNELSHSEINNRYPFVISKDVLDLIQKLGILLLLNNIQL